MKRRESWRQDPTELDLWLGENGVLINTAALEERAYYSDIMRLPVQVVAASELMGEPAPETYAEHIP